MDTKSPTYVNNRKAAGKAVQKTRRVEQIKAFWTCSATRQPDGTITLLGGRLDLATNRMTFSELGQLEFPAAGDSGMVTGVVEAAYRVAEEYAQQQELPY